MCVWMWGPAGWGGEIVGVLGLPGGGNFVPGLGLLPLSATHNVHRPLYRVGAACHGESSAYFRGERGVLRVGVVGSFGWR